MIWVTAEDVVAIHSRIIQVSGGIDVTVKPNRA